MEYNYNEILANNILFLRKQNNMTQEELACICNISFQAISKWENNLTSPDISLLPIIAKRFKVSIDDLFNPNFSLQDDVIGSDEDIKVVVYQGDKEILSKNPLFEKVQIEIIGDVKNLYGYGDLSFLETVNIKGNLDVNGNLKIETASTGSVKVGGDFKADTLSTGSINCNDLKVDSLASGSIKANDIVVDRMSSGSIKVDNNIKANSIKCQGDLVCNGNIEISTEVHAKHIRGKILRDKEVKEGSTIERGDIKEYKSGMNDFKKEIKAVQKECQDLLNQLKGFLIKEKDEDLLDGLEDIQDDLVDLDEGFDDLLEDIDDIEEDISEIEDEEDVNSINEDINELQADFNNAMIEFNNLKGKFNQFKVVK